MSQRNIADETFGDISQFVTLNRNRTTEESLGVLSEGISDIEPLHPEQQSDTASKTKVMNEENYPVHESVHDESSFSLKPEHQNLDSSNPTNVVGSSSPNDMRAGLNTARSEDDSELYSWSGPDISSGPESWGASDNGSLFQGKSGLHTTCQNSDRGNTLTNDSFAPIPADFTSSDTDENVQMEKPNENPDNFENYDLPGNDLTVHQELESELDTSQGNAVSKENPNEKDISDDSSDCKATQFNHLNINDGSNDNVIVGRKEDESDVDSPALDTTHDPNNILNADGIETKHTSDSESISSNMTETEVSLVDNDRADNDEKIDDDDVSIKNHDANGGNVNIDENSESENSAAQDENSEGSLANKDEIVVNLNDNDDLDIQEEDNENGWTVLELWSFFAMALGVLPYWISNNGRVTQVHRPIASTILWTLSLVMYAAELICAIPKVVAVLNSGSSAQSYLYLGIHISFVIFYIAFIRMAFTKESNFVDANNQLLNFPGANMKKWQAGLVLWMLFSTTIISTLLHILFQTQLENNFAKIGFDNVLRYLECVGEKTLTMSTICNPSSMQSFLQATWAISGFLMTAREVTIGIVAVLEITILCGTLLWTSYTVEGAEGYIPDDEFAHFTTSDLTNISKLADDMSKVIGEALVGYLIYHALHTPSEFPFIFSGSPFALLSFIVKHGLIYVGLILGSIASLRIKWISNAISARGHTASHQVVRPGTAMILAYIQETISGKSIGIGLQGVFVINFKITLSYMGIVGAFVTLILYEEKFPIRTMQIFYTFIFITLLLLFPMGSPLMKPKKNNTDCDKQCQNERSIQKLKDMRNKTSG